ncbi:unnamed protein product [Alopecurus aequalis]
MAAPTLSNPWPWPLVTLISALFILPLLYLFFFRSGRQRARKRDAPGPPKQLPVLGNLLQLGSRPHRYFQAVASKYGPVVQVQLGRVRMVVVSSPEAAKEVLRTNDLHCCSRPNSPGARMLSYNFLDVAFGPYSDYWREMRKLLVLELLSTRRVQSFAYARAAEVDRLIDSLSVTPLGTLVDLSEKLYALSDGIIGTVAFGKIFTFEDFFPSSALAHWADVLTGVARQRRRVFRRIDGFFDAVIDKHLEPERLAAGVQEDMVDALVKIWRDDRDAPLALTRENIKGILMDTFTGGIDTCAVTTIWIMSELIRNPRVMRKAQSKVRAAVPSKPRVHEEDVQRLRYLKMILKENFRLHPPGTLLIPRETMQSCEIAGYSVPAGTRLHVNVWAMGRDPDIWDRPQEFYPERFEDADVDFRGFHFELLPFGSGRRACPAIAMGVANVELVLANLLYCFDWELPKGMKEEDIDMEETGQLVFRKKVPLSLVPVKH